MTDEHDDRPTESGDAGEADVAANNEAAEAEASAPRPPDGSGTDAAGSGGIKFPDWYDDSFHMAHGLLYLKSGNCGGAGTTRRTGS
jgi:hypothetical protein